MPDHLHVVKKESEEDKSRRKFSQKQIKEERKEKHRLRDTKEKQEYLRLSNIFAQLGVDYFGKAMARESSYEEARKLWEGKRAEDLAELSEETRQFLKTSLPFHLEKDNWGVNRIRFNAVDLTGKESDSPKAPSSKTLQVLTKLSEQPYSSVEAVYNSLLLFARKQLAKHRKCRLPGLVRLSVRYRPALPARKGINPWTKQEVSMPASPEQNRLKVRPDRELREWVEDKKNIPVSAPPEKHRKKSKKKEKLKRKPKKRYTRYFDEQKQFHIA